MAMVRASAVGAVTLFAGLSLAGPQAMGVAAADAPDRDSGSVSAGPSDTGAAVSRGKSPGARTPARRADHSVNSPVPAAAETPSDSSASETPSDSPATPRAAARSASVAGGVMGAVTRPQSRQRASAPAAAAVAPTAGRAEAAPVAGAISAGVKPAAASLGVISPAAVVTAPLVGAPAAVLSAPVVRAAASAAPQLTAAPSAAAQRIQTIKTAVAWALDDVHKWLSGFGPNPITDLLAGALWQLRRTLLPAGAGVSAGGLPKCLQDSGKNCSNQNLKGANLSGESLTGVNFNGANLIGANLSKATLDNATLVEAILPGANLSGATGKNVNFANALLSGGYQGSAPQATIFADAKLQGANFYGVNNLRLWEGSYYQLPLNMKSVNLSGANLTQAVLAGVDLTGAELTDVILLGRVPDGVEDNVGNGGADLSGATLVNANLSNAHFVTDDSYGTRPLSLASADLTGARLQKASFVFGGAYGCDGDNDNPCAILDAATFYNADLTGATLENITAYSVKWADYKYLGVVTDPATCPNGEDWAGEDGAGNCPVGRVN